MSYIFDALFFVVATGVFFFATDFIFYRCLYFAHQWIPLLNSHKVKVKSINCDETKLKVSLWSKKIMWDLSSKLFLLNNSLSILNLSILK